MNEEYEELWQLESCWPFLQAGHAGRLTLQLGSEDVAEDGAGEQHHTNISQATKRKSGELGPGERRGSRSAER